MLTIKYISATLFKAYFALACVLALSGCSGQPNYHTFGGHAQGGVWQVKANITNVKLRTSQIQKNIEAILEDIDTTLSGYNKGSLLSRLNAGDTIVPNAMLCKVYNDSHDLWHETDGALDCAAGPLYDIWGFGFKGGGFPTDEQVAEALAIGGMGRLVHRIEFAIRDGKLHASWLYSSIDTSSKTSIPRLNFNAVAQGFSCDTVASYLNKIGVKDMLVDIGEIWCRGLNASGKPWRVGVDRPTDGNNSPGADLDGIWESNNPKGQGLVTSGNYRRFFLVDGIKYPHTVDPRTGYPVGGNPLLSATVVAETGELADAYATYCMVIGLDEAKEFLCSRPDLEGYLIYDTFDGMEEWSSEGFNLLK